VTAYEKPRPRIGPDNEPFWHGCRAHRLMLPTCRACGKPHLPPGAGLPVLLLQRHQLASSFWPRVHLYLDDGSQGMVPGVQG
jgi:hypothetical protein